MVARPKMPVSVVTPVEDVTIATSGARRSGRRHVAGREQVVHGAAHELCELVPAPSRSEDVRAMSSAMIEAHGLRKRFGATVALDAVDLEVPAGTILGVLRPNGAGKTTAVRILTTLALPDGGWARVAGHDVVGEASAVRLKIGVTAQDATLDEVLTGRENLVMIGRLSGLRRADARARASDLLDEFDLADAAERILKQCSGGMRRRLDLAAGLLTRPPVLFLDEPRMRLGGILPSEP
jgi:ABC-type multidrug transport system ATPase subunit